MRMENYFVTFGWNGVTWGKVGEVGRSSGGFDLNADGLLVWLRRSGYGPGDGLACGVAECSFVVVFICKDDGSQEKDEERGCGDELGVAFLDVQDNHCCVKH